MGNAGFILSTVITFSSRSKDLCRWQLHCAVSEPTPQNILNPALFSYALFNEGW